MLSTIASLFASPFFSPCTKVLMICMLSAMARVMIIFMKEAEAGVRYIPNHPPIPIAVAIENITTNNVEMVPVIVLVKRKLITNILYNFIIYFRISAVGYFYSNVRCRYTSLLIHQAIFHPWVCDGNLS